MNCNARRARADLRRCGLVRADHVALLVGEGAENDEDEVHDPADAEEAAGEEPEQTCADLADIKAMDSQHSDEEAEQKGRPEVFVAGSLHRTLLSHGPSILAIACAVSSHALL